MISSDNFGKFISSKRNELKISQVALAKKLNVDPKTLSKWENGGSYPDLESASKLAEIFNMSLSDIINGNFDAKIINKKKIFTFDNIYVSLLIVASIALVIIKNLNIFHFTIRFRFVLSIIFLFNNFLIIILIFANNKKICKMLKIFAKIMLFITASFLFVL